MTKKKDRVIQPYTCNAAASALGGFDEPLKKVVKRFFDEESYPSISERILQAVTTYNLDFKINPDRKRTQQQRHDRHELIECLKELHIRLDRLHIPLPLQRAVKSTYIPHMWGKATLDDEIRDLLLRLWHLKKLFEANPIPTPNKTNPGKPERDHLAKTLGVIFDDSTSYNSSPYLEGEQDQSSLDLQREKKHDKEQFVEQVFHVFHLEPPCL